MTVTGSDRNRLWQLLTSALDVATRLLPVAFGPCSRQRLTAAAVTLA